MLCSDMLRLIIKLVQIDNHLLKIELKCNLVIGLHLLTLPLESEPD